MRAELDRLVRCFERGAISRRELLAGLGAVCTAAGTASAFAHQPASPAPIPLSGMDHIALRVSDLARSTAFYRDHLGGRIRSESPGSVFLDVGSHWVALFARGTATTGLETRQAGVDHISFHSPKHRSLEARMAVLRDHGLDPTSPAGSNRVYFRDPDGIVLQLS